MEESEKNNEGKNKKPDKILKKWWFWTFITIITLIIVLILLISFKTDTSVKIQKVSKEINEELKGANLFCSQVNKTLILELKDFNTEKNIINYSNIIKIIKDSLNNELKDFSKLEIISWLANDDNGADNNNNLLIVTTYQLPDFKEVKKENYINFEAYNDLYNTYDNAMKGYTDLFMSIGH